MRRHSFVIPNKSWSIRQLLEMQSKGQTLPRLTTYTLRDNISVLVRPNFDEPVRNLSDVFDRTSAFSDCHKFVREVQLKAAQARAVSQKAAFEDSVRAQEASIRYSDRLNGNGSAPAPDAAAAPAPDAAADAGASASASLS